jgi:peroxiredoxin
MKNILIIFCLLLNFAKIGHAQNNFAGNYSVRIEVSQLSNKPRTIYLRYISAQQKLVSDTLLVTGNIIEAKGIVKEPVMANITTQPANGIFYFYLDRSAIKIIGGNSLNTSVIIGSSVQRNFEEVNRQEKQFSLSQDSLRSSLILAEKQKDTSKIEKINSGFLTVSRELAYYYKNYCIKYATTSPVSVYALSRFMNISLYDFPNTADSLYNLLLPEYKSLPTALYLKSNINIQLSIAIGKFAPVFTQPDTSGKLINLSLFHSKYLLIDFWASWCRPCRELNPDLIKLYQKYHSRNFEILSISLDAKNAKDNWLNAIHTDHVGSWFQVSDLKGVRNAAAALYGIDALPQNFLIDTKGKIIAKNLSNEELDKLLERLTNEGK